MDITAFMKKDGEKPLDNLVSNGGLCGIFRRIACIGDSLSSGEFESFECDKKGYHDYYEYSWGQYMARDIGCTVYNFSCGGMSAKEYDTFARKNGYYTDQYKSQAYIIALGVNDISAVLRGEYEFGDENDVNLSDYAKNKPTFAGYYARIIAKYQAIQPKAKFFLVTSPRKESPDDERAEYYARHAALLHKFSEMFENCYVIDLHEHAPVYDKEFRARFYLGGHLNAAGYRLTALMMESYIDYIIRDRYEDFKQVGFIGTPYHNALEKW